MRIPMAGLPMDAGIDDHNYFKAVETHSMSALPTATNLRITENRKDKKPSERLLLSGGKVQLRRDVIDAGGGSHFSTQRD